MSRYKAILQEIHDFSARRLAKNQSWSFRVLYGFIYAFAAFLGDSESLYDLGFMIFNSEIWPIPVTLGHKLIVRAAKKGCIPALNFVEGEKGPVL